MKTHHQNQTIDSFLTGVSGMDLNCKPDPQFNVNGGLTAALMMNAEMYGTGAIAIKAIMDEHVITSEGL